MLTRFRVYPTLAALLALAPLAAASQPAPPAEAPATLPKFVVKESQAEAFYIRASEGETTRIFFVSLDRPGLSRLPDDTRHLTFKGYLNAFRSHDLRPGDELLAIAGRPVARMTFHEWSAALRATSDQPPVRVTVRARGATEPREAAVLPHQAVTLGAKVLPASRLPAPPAP